MKVDGNFELYEYPKGCPTCGADAYVIEMHIGNWRKWVGICICCPSGTWTIIEPSLAHKAFLAKKKDIA